MGSRSPFVFIVVVALASLFIADGAARADGPDAPAKAGKPAPARDLAEYRAKFPTTLTVHGPPPKEWENTQPLALPKGVHEVTYESGTLKLKAWINDVPPGAKLHPAVVFCHGGFSFGNDDWAAVKPLVDAGFVVMMPRVRSENGGPGELEFYYGEVDDVIAAGTYLATVKGVDPKRIFVSGHSAGGALAALAVEKESPFVLSAPIGADLDIRSAPRWPDARHQKLIVFDVSDPHELESRSALLFTAGLRAPIHFFQGKQDGTGDVQKRFLTLAHSFKRPATLTFVEGRHGPSLDSAMPEIVKLFQDYAPARHVEIKLPGAWKDAELPGYQGAKQTGMNLPAGGSFAVFTLSKDLVSENFHLDDFANANRELALKKGDFSHRSDTELAGQTIGTMKVHSFETIGTVQNLKVHILRYFLETDHFFVQIFCSTTDAKFQDARGAFEQLVKGVVETTEDSGKRPAAKP